MTSNAPARRPPPAARRVGYVIAGLLSLGFWYVVNVAPGWPEAPFLTGDTARVIPLLNLSLIVSVAVNALYLGYDEPWLRSLGDLVTTGIGVAVLVRVWQVFPFAFTGSFDWSLLVRVLLVLGIAGSLVAIVVGLVGLVRSVLHPGVPGPARR